MRKSYNLSNVQREKKKEEGAEKKKSKKPNKKRKKVSSDEDGKSEAEPEEEEPDRSPKKKPKKEKKAKTEKKKGGKKKKRSKGADSDDDDDMAEQEGSPEPDPSDIPGRIQHMLRKMIQTADLTTLTSRLCKEHIKEQFGEQGEAVSVEHKQLIKDTINYEVARRGT